MQRYYISGSLRAAFLRTFLWLILRINQSSFWRTHDGQRRRFAKISSENARNNTIIRTKVCTFRLGHHRTFRFRRCADTIRHCLGAHKNTHKHTHTDRTVWYSAVQLVAPPNKNAHKYKAVAAVPTTADNSSRI